MSELDGVFEAVSGYFSLLSEPVRLRILNAICHQERTVSEIVEITGATQSNVSRHLGILYRGGALARRKAGNCIHYRVADPVLTEICRTVCVHIAARDTLPGPAEFLAVAEQLQGSRSSARRDACTSPGMPVSTGSGA